MLTRLIPISDQERIKRFVKVFLDRCTTVSITVPDAMQSGPKEEGGWTPWKSVDSPISDEEILEIEEEFGITFPSLFRAYVMYKCLLMTDFAVILPETPVDDPLRKLKGYLDLWRSEPFFRDRQLVPFAYDADGIGPVCFDIGHRSENGDCPIIRVDWGQIRMPSYNGERIAGSFAELLDQIEAELLSYDLGT